MAKWIYGKYEIDWDFEKIMDVGSTNVSFGFGYKVSLDGYIFRTRIRNPQDRVMYAAQENWGSSYMYLKMQIDGTLYGLGKLSKDELLNNYQSTGEALETIEAEDGTLPDNGLHSDGYWYVKLKKAVPTMVIGGKEIKSIQYKDKNGDLLEINTAQYKNSSGNLIDLV